MKNNIKECRKELAMNQEELGQAMEVSRQTISSLESGRYNPSIELAIKLARFFNRPVEKLFIYEEEK